MLPLPPGRRADGGAAGGGWALGGAPFPKEFTGLIPNVIMPAEDDPRSELVRSPPGPLNDVDGGGNT